MTRPARPAVRRLLPLLLLALASAAPAAAGDAPAPPSAGGASPPPEAALPAPPTPGLERILAEMHPPAASRLVSALAASAPDLSPAEAERAARTLAHAGGPEAARGLRALLEHRDPAVRAQVCAAAADLGLRSDALTERIRRAAEEGKPGEREAAVAALSVLGDGRDLERLLSLAECGDVPLEFAAYRALTRMTGARIPYVHARWSHHVKTFRMRAALLLPQALLALPTAYEAPDSEALLDLVRRYGWVDLPAVRDTAAVWLLDPAFESRRLACRLIGEFRLADLAADVESAARHVPDRATTAEAERTLVLLGARVAIEPVSGPPAGPAAGPAEPSAAPPDPGPGDGPPGDDPPDEDR